jgi:hypothetical protein
VTTECSSGSAASHTRAFPGNLIFPGDVVTVDTVAEERFLFIGKKGERVCAGSILSISFSSSSSSSSGIPSAILFCFKNSLLLLFSMSDKYT